VEKFLYRFRPVKNLLERKELEDSYIYFASPEQLNDPLEGHREEYWSGDAIVWENFFRHYFLCLIKRGSLYFIVDDFSKHDFPIHASLSDIPSEIRETTEQTQKLFLENDNIKQHIEILSADARKVRIDELKLHLRSIQPLAVKHLSTLFIKQGFLPESYELTALSDDELLVPSTNFIKQYRTPDNSIHLTDEHYRIAINSLDSQDLVRGYDKWKKNINKNEKWSKLSTGFPDDYLQNLKALYRPKWYAACFMESPFNSSIWGTYGQEHRGVCLKFRVTNIDEIYRLNLTRSTSSGRPSATPFELRKVSYSERPLDLNFFQSISCYPFRRLMEDWYTDSNGEISTCAGAISTDIEKWRENFYEEYTQSITTKLKDWSGETEYRIPLTSSFENFEAPESRCLSYDFESLDGIIFGINTPVEEKHQIIKVIDGLCEKHNREAFNIYQAYYDSEHLQVKYRLLLQVTGITSD
jgi:hypothetical protein